LCYNRAAKALADIPISPAEWVEQLVKNKNLWNGILKTLPTPPQDLIHASIVQIKALFTRAVSGGEEEKLKALEERFNEQELAQIVATFAHILATNVAKK